MELWELVARESVRDLVVRYNANGDSGRFAEVRTLFADDAVMVLDDRTHTGIDEIMTIFTSTQDTLATPAARSAQGSTEQAPPTYLRHMTATHQIDVIDPQTAKGRCYFQVLTRIGLDHWGRYIDDYRLVDGAWKFARRRVHVDGYGPGSLFGTA